MEQDNNKRGAHDSCEGCMWNLGGGCCRMNLEDECRAGGGFEAWEAEKA